MLFQHQFWQLRKLDAEPTHANIMQRFKRILTENTSSQETLPFALLIVIYYLFSYADDRTVAVRNSSEPLVHFLVQSYACINQHLHVKKTMKYKKDFSATKPINTLNSSVHSNTALGYFAQKYILASRLEAVR